MSYNRSALLAYVREMSFAALDDLRAGRITTRELNRRSKAAGILIRGARDGEPLDVLRAKVKTIFLGGNR